jgi:two-component system, OmpR family, phosphate regulon sensor histidine kinase PhoR
MKNTPIRFIIVLGSLTLIGIIFTQVFWVSKAVNNQEEAFNYNVKMALRNVVESLCELNGNDIPNDPIDQISTNYFIARTKYSINLSSLSFLISDELLKRNIKENFEFGVYDCQTESMVYGDFITYGEEKVKPLGRLPKLENEEYYFGVYFPDKTPGLVSGLGFWQFTSLLTVLITVFFGYAMFVILRQKRLSEIQKDFINNMTHEFKTPLSTLILAADVLANEAQSERGKKYASIIKSESERLQHHVTRLLDTTSAEYHVSNSKTSIDVHQVLQATTDRFSTFKIPITLTLKNEVLIIHGNAESFEKILFNLIDNAVKYGRSFVEIQTSSIGKQLLIQISNDGEMIAKGEGRRIFHQFYRIPSGDRHDVKGFGLGLFFVKKAIAGFKGQVDFQSDSQKTIFTLKIPLR